MRRAAAVLVLLGACDLAREEPAPDAGPGEDAGGYPLPSDDVVPPIGGADTLDIAAWNIENFPAQDETASDVADLITSLDLDLVVCEEIASIAAWNELLERLPGHSGVLSTHMYTPTDYQKIGLIYRDGLVTVGEPELLFVSESYDFPRPPFLVHVDVGGWKVDLVGVHLKAGTADDDIARRHDAVITLDAWLRTRTEDTIVLGDWNATLDASRPDLAQVWPPITGAPDLYTIRTQAASDADETSFLPAGIILDHIVTTAGLADEVGARDAVIPPLDEQYEGYINHVSDHLPVTLSFPMPSAE